MNKRGSNQYAKRPRKLLQQQWCGLKIGTWINVYLIIFIASILTAYCYANRPIKLISPIGQAHAEGSSLKSLSSPALNLPKPTPILPKSTYDYVMSLPHGDIVWRIYGNESSFGKNTFIYCKKQGLVNDVGYNVLGKPPTCFASFEDEMLKVSRWFDAQLKTHTLAEALCIYNEGKDLQNCRYAQDFLHL